jgi:hypothetical protein
MLLKSTIIRTGGTYPGMAGADYHFTGPEGGPHTCEVFDLDDIAALLATEVYAYAEADEDDADDALEDATFYYRDKIGRPPAASMTTAEIVDATLAFEADARTAAAVTFPPA